MVAQLISRTHLQNTFFIFLSRLVRVWLQSLQKVLLWLNKYLFFKNAKWVSKIWCWFRISWKIAKGVMQKSYQQNSFRKIEFLTCITVRKSFRPTTSFGWFFPIFQRIRTRHQIFFIFWYPYEILAQNFFLLILALFANFKAKRQYIY
jgi:hypothetical protein